MRFLVTAAKELKTTKGDKMKFAYSFDELEILKNYAVTVAGEVDVDYSVARAEPDVGIFEPYIDDIDITSIVIHSNKKDVPALNISQDHWLYALIYDALIDSEHLAQACIDDANYEADI